MRGTDGDNTREIGQVSFIGLAVVVGLVTGFVALGFRALIAFLERLLFFGELSLAHDADTLMGLSPWGALVILVPVLGGLVVVWITRNFSGELKGSGVPDVMDAIYHREGRIRPGVALSKSVASALSIGSGASVGREGPIVQIGSSLGSTMGQLGGLVPWQRTTLLSCGAGAGIAATFNTPLGGVMFALELLLPEISNRTLLPVVLATATATYIGRIFLGIEPAFAVPVLSVPEVDWLSVYRFGAYAGLGVICGLVAYLFIRLLEMTEGTLMRLGHNEYLRHGLAMLLVGLIIYLLGMCYGQYYINGTGYGTISAILDGQLVSMELLAVLFLAKLAATALSLGSGAAGGIFSPSLFLGATLGAASGALLETLWPGIGLGPVAFALLGMAGVVGGGTGAAMTAIVMIFEMTGDYHIMLPMVTVVVVAILVRRGLSAESIYTIKLAARGRAIPEARDCRIQ